MREDELRQQIRPTGVETAFVWFIRLLALYSLALGVYYWVRLIGLHPGLLWRFDLMPWPWQAAVVALAVLMPVAATGLWLRATWGPVIWFVGAAVEISIYWIFSRMFEDRPFIAVFNVACIVIYLAFRIALIVQKKRTLRGNVEP